MSTRHDTILLDVDGTLVDSTYHHAVAWHRAFRSHDIPLPLWRVHRAIGMGGDLLVGALAGQEVEDRIGDELRAAWAREYEPLRAEIEPLPGAVDLLRELKRRGFLLALASSGKPDHTRQALDLLGVADLLSAVTTSEDADTSKPAPDILGVALRRAGGTSALVIGDSTYDIEAATNLGAPCIATRAGGYGADELRRAGAVLVADGMVDLLEADWDGLATAGPAPSSGS